MKTIEKIVRAQKSEEKAEESLAMKRLYTAFLEGGLKIDEAVVLLRGNGKNEEMKKMDEKSEMKMKNEEIENREKRQGSIACEQDMC